MTLKGKYESLLHEFVNHKCARLTKKKFGNIFDTDISIGKKSAIVLKKLQKKENKIQVKV